MAPQIPKALIKKRMHSLTGLWLVVFLIEHLLTNSQAALWMGDEGASFVRAVNAIKNYPYLPFIEIFLLALPLLVHALFGIGMLFSASYNSFTSDGRRPALPQYGRNQAYTWQRMTAWILLFGIAAHVIQMRVIHYPTSFPVADHNYFIHRLSPDASLSLLADRFGVALLDQPFDWAGEDLRFPSLQMKTLFQKISLDKDLHARFIQAIQKWSLNQGEVIAVSPSFGVAELLLVRETFKNPWMVFLYTALVLAACFHAFNGLWTLMITWGVTVTARSQVLMKRAAVFLMLAVLFLGLSAIFGS